MTAAVTALAPMSLNASVLVPAVASAVGVDAIAELPEWIPDDYESALEFRNTYGATHIGNGLICVVYPETVERGGASDGGSSLWIDVTANMGQPLSQERYLPDRSDTAFNVYVYQPLKAGNIDISITDPNLAPVPYGGYGSPAKDSQLYAYSFAVDEQLDVTETDIYSWLPDSDTEYREFVRNNRTQPAYVKDNYLLFFLSSNSGTPYGWTNTEGGNKCLTLQTVSDCTPYSAIPLEGGAENTIYVYKAWKDGREKVTYEFLPMYSGASAEATRTADCVVYNNAKNILLSGQMKVTLTDYDTGELLSWDAEKAPSISTDIRFYEPEGTMSTGPILMLEENPSVHENIGGMFGADYFAFYLDKGRLPEGYVFPGNVQEMGYLNGKAAPEDGVTLQRFENGSADVVFRLRKNVDGDVNGDGAFDISDVVVLQKWLQGSDGAELANWSAADFTKDGKLNVFDLCLMRRKLISKNNDGVVEPDVKTEWGTLLTVVVPDLKVHIAPDENSRTVALIPNNTDIKEWGYQNDNNDWLYTEYNGKYGWIKVFDENGDPTIRYLMVAKKPVIYLYPEQETDVHVELELTDAELSTTYPKYNNGWDVTAYPDGTLINKADGTHHKYLFWDAVNCRTRYDFSKGFCVAGSDTESFLREKLTYLGLTEQEMNEFIVYWLPVMEHNKYNLITFQGEAYTDAAKLDISPVPDSLLRVFMVFVPLEEAVDIEPQQLSTFERNGFTAVEWGGSEVR